MGSDKMMLQIMVEVQKDQAERMLKALQKTIKDVEADVQKVTRRFNMWSLSFLFTGMAMQRVAKSFFDFAFNKWEQYEGYQGAALDATMRLSAGWEFLRFSIFNALGQSELFQRLVTFLVDAFNWLSQFVNQHPEIIAIVATFTGLVGVLGSAMIAGSLIFQFFELIKVTKEWYNIKFIGSLLDKGLTLISLFLWGTAGGGKDGIIQKLQTVYGWIKKIYAFTIAGSLLEAGLLAFIGYLGTIIKKLIEIKTLMKTVGLLGTISAMVAAAPVTVATGLVVAGAIGSYKTSQALQEGEKQKIMETNNMSREEAVELMSRNTQEILRQGPLKVDIVNTDMLNTKFSLYDTTSSTTG